MRPQFKELLLHVFGFYSQQTCHKTLNVSVIVWVTKCDLLNFVTLNAVFYEIWFVMHYVHSKVAFFPFCIQNSKLQNYFHGHNGECTFNFVDNRKQNMSQNAFCPQIIHFINVICILCNM